MNTRHAQPGLNLGDDTRTLTGAICETNPHARHRRVILLTLDINSSTKRAALIIKFHISTPVAYVKRNKLRLPARADDAEEAYGLIADLLKGCRAKLGEGL